MDDLGGYGGVPLFQDRVDAGRRLAERLERFRGQPVVVVALPRGGVVVGYEVAKALGAPLDVLVARKLGAPGRSELGIGAIAPGGVRILDEAAIEWLGISEEQLDRLTAREDEEMRRRVECYRGGREAVDVTGKTAIIVDDGLATGVTARAAIAALRRQDPERIVLAVPVCAADTADGMRALADEVVCNACPSNFRAVGLWYADFSQTTDEEVIELLRKAITE